MEVLGVAWRDTEEAMEAFVERHGIGFPTVVDTDGAIFTRFGLFYQPAWAFVDAEGNLEVVFGALSDERLRAELDALAG